jgi:hypothetical protein
MLHHHPHTLIPHPYTITHHHMHHHMHHPTPTHLPPPNRFASLGLFIFNPTGWAWSAGRSNQGYLEQGCPQPAGWGVKNPGVNFKICPQNSRYGTVFYPR